MKKLCYVATIPAAVHAFLRGHIQAAAEKYEVTVICNNVDIHLLEGLNARLVVLPIERKPSPWKDLLVLFQLFKLFRHERFDIVHSMIPKTGLLAMLAAWIARVPTRIHIFTGQVWATKQGWRRRLFKFFDKLIVFFATHILVDSQSQQDFLVTQGVLLSGRAKIIAAGSICGVDPLRFHPDAEAGKTMRHHLGIALEAKVILFVGRLNRDKGMLDLANAFAKIAKYRLDVELVLVGSEEDIPFSRIQEVCGEESKRLHYVSFTTMPECYMAAADIFCLPSYREGFGMTIIEAAACGIPTVATQIYGITDAVENGKTGLLFPVGDVTALTQALLTLIENHSLRQQMGEAAKNRALTLFSCDTITTAMLAFYDEILIFP